MSYQETLSAMFRDKSLTSKQMKEIIKLRQYGWMVKALGLVLERFNLVGSNPTTVSLFDWIMNIFEKNNMYYWWYVVLFYY